jgi:hypothetical protein
VQHRAEALTLVDWPRIEANDNFYEPVLLFRLSRLADLAFHPLYRRFLCACCRVLEPLLSEESRRALDVIEAFASGRASFTELVAARDVAKVIARRVAKEEGRGSTEYAAAEAVRDSARNNSVEALILCLRGCRRAGLTIRQIASLFEQVASQWVAEKAEIPVPDTARPRELME